MEYARNVAGIVDAGHAEIDSAGTMVVVPLTCSLAGEYREVRTVPGTKAAAICGAGPMAGYHFCGYCLAPEMVPLLETTGLIVSGYADDGTIEIVEIPGHSFLLATLFQPQVSPDDGELHPLLLAFADAVLTRHRIGPDTAIKLAKHQARHRGRMGLFDSPHSAVLHGPWDTPLRRDQVSFAFGLRKPFPPW